MVVFFVQVQADIFQYMEQLHGLTDSHCHLDVACKNETIDDLAKFLRSLDHTKFGHFLHLMSTNVIDLNYIDRLLDKLDTCDIVVPYFGVHPWYSHLFSVHQYNDLLTETEIKRLHYTSILKPEPDNELLAVLPAPISMDIHLSHIRLLIDKHGDRFGFGVGEIGLDKLFRVPRNGFYGNPDISLENEAVKMSPCRVTMEHQLEILRCFLRLAEEYQCAVSLHCVKAHGVLYDEIRRFGGISTVILHSYSGSLDHAKAWISHYYYKDGSPSKQLRLMFSLSQCINGANDDKLACLVDILPEAAILVESDYPIDRFLLDLSGPLRNKYIQDLSSVFSSIANTRSVSVHDLHLIIDSNVATVMKEHRVVHCQLP